VTPPAIPKDSEPMSRTTPWSARREVGLFLALTAAGCLALTGIAAAEDFDAKHIDDSSALGAVAAFSMAFVPGLAAIVVRLLSSGGLRGLGWGRGATSRSVLAACWLAPVGLFAVAYGIVWAVGAGDVSPDGLAEDGMPAPVAAIVGLTAGVAGFTLLALGEEVGWRGLLVPRLAETMSLQRVALVSGVAWTAFHVPLMLLVDGYVEGVPTGYAVAMFAIGTLALSLPLAWIRLRTRSVWAPAVLHAAYNAALYLVADPLTADTGDTDWFAGESGAVVTAVTVVAVALWWRGVASERGLRRRARPALAR
jgi:membrane protease YdiL (CAAX protease family)